MTIKRSDNDGVLTISLEGWLDTTTSPDLAAEIEKIEAIRALVLDFADLEYISSAGLRQVAASAKKAKSLGADFSIINANPNVMSVFQLTALDKKFHITEK